MTTTPAFPKVGQLVSFEADRASLELGVPVPAAWDHPADRLCCAVGTVVDVRPMEPHGPGAIPTACVTIEGRSGKRVAIDGAGCRLKVWGTWAEALAEAKRVNGPKAATLPKAGKGAG